MQYICRVGTPDGRVIEETFNAPDESSLRARTQPNRFVADSCLYDLRPGLRQLALNNVRYGARYILFLRASDSACTRIAAAVPCLDSNGKSRQR